MSIENEVLFSTTPTPELGWGGLVTGICFAPLFRGGWDEVDKKLRYVHAVYRLDANDISLLRANWWVRNILDRLPPEIKGGFSISRVPHKYRGIVYQYYDNHPAWIRVTMDGSVLSATEIYMLLSLFRYPQERADVVKWTRIIMKQYGFSFDTAYLFAGSNDDHSGHGMVTQSTWIGIKQLDKDEARKIIVSYSLSKIFNKFIKIREEENSYLENPCKSTANKHFQPDKTKYSAWGSCMPYSWEGKPSPVGTVAQYLLERFGFKPLEKETDATIDA